MHHGTTNVAINLVNSAFSQVRQAGEDYHRIRLISFNLNVIEEKRKQNSGERERILMDLPFASVS